MSSSPPLKRILVVEDEGDLRGLVTRILEDSGYAVLAAEDGWSASGTFGWALRPSLNSALMRSRSKRITASKLRRDDASPPLTRTVTWRATGSALTNAVQSS